MWNYLEAMSKALYMGPEPSVDAPIVIGALRDKMLELSASATPRVPIRTTSPPSTKALMGPKALLLPEQMVPAETDPTKARDRPRAAQALPPAAQLPEQP